MKKHRVTYKDYDETGVVAYNAMTIDALDEQDAERKFNEIWGLSDTHIISISTDIGVIIATGQEVVIKRKQMGRYLVEFPSGKVYWYSREKIREL